MALLDAYATAAQFRARTGSKASGADTELDDQLLEASRLVERSLGVHSGGFNSHTGTYTFDAFDDPVLYLRDREGMLYFLQTVGANAIGVDSEGDGSFDGYQFDFDDAWVRGLPENASALSRPYTAIELLPIASATLTRWPDRPAAVRITSGTFGWATVPTTILELTVHLTHSLRQAHLADNMGNIPAIDQTLPLSPNAVWYWRLAEREYKRRLPVVV